VQSGQDGPVSGHVFRVDGVRGSVWYAKYRLADGRQVKKRIGPAATGRGRPPAGTYSRRTAQAWLDDLLAEARAGTLPGASGVGVLFDEAAAEWLRYVEFDRAVKPSYLRSCRAAVRPFLAVFGGRRCDEITRHDVERWRRSLTSGARTRNKLLTQLTAIFKRAQRVWDLPRNPAGQVDKLREQTYSDLEVFSPEEVHALVRAAASEQDAALFLTAAFTGLRRGELLALRWRDVDFAGCVVRVRASYAYGHVTTPKSGKVRAVPLAPAVAHALARLAARPRWTSDDDLVFCGELGGFLDGSALRRRYGQALERGGVRRLRFHDLRHTFGTRMIGKADIVRVKEWMGHASVSTTMRYLHYAPRPEDARLVAEAFAVTSPPLPPGRAGSRPGHGSGMHRDSERAVVGVRGGDPQR
jgi:integrase